eukprot:m.301171 g.301171  ORF g.301171 m.301171 type:complete len:1246 (+) comp27269_c0_seq1:80-3817(+)
MAGTAWARRWRVTAVAMAVIVGGSSVCATAAPTTTPSSLAPTLAPLTPAPTAGPTTAVPSVSPSSTRPTPTPTVGPTPAPTRAPTPSPTTLPTLLPTAAPTNVPTTLTPTSLPTTTPTSLPTTTPTSAPTATPSAGPTSTPTSSPTAHPTSVPTFGPTAHPTISPTQSISTHERNILTAILLKTGSQWGGVTTKCTGWGLGSDPCGGGTYSEKEQESKGLNNSGGHGWGQCVVCDETNTTVVGLFLEGVGMTGPVPTEVCELPNLRVFDASSNMLSGALDRCFCHMPKLARLSLHHNQLSGSLPTCIPQLGNTLKVLRLEDNDLTGPFPSLCNLTSLQQLAIGNNVNLDPGALPPCLCLLQNLTQLRFEGTHRTGHIPPCIFQLPRLYNFSAGRNSLTGAIPNQLCFAKPLMFIYLGFNKFTGELPDCIGNLTNLNTLRLESLQITGSLPQTLFNLPGLQILLITRAQLTGGIPATVQHNQNISFKSWNVFEPKEAWGPPLGKLRLLGLVACGLTGQLPAWISGLTKLEVLALGGNYLSGSLPTFRPGAQLKQLQVTHNHFTGTLEPLSGLTLLIALDASSNQITGSVPKWLGHLSSSMDQIRLDNTFLSCNLPSQLTIKQSGALHVLKGNVFGRPIPHGVTAHDPDAVAYSPGSSQLVLAAATFGSTLVLAMIAFIGFQCCGPKGTNPSVFSSRTHRLKMLIGGAIGAVALVLVGTLMPIYWFADSQIECQYGWRSTAAFLQPWPAAGAIWTLGMAFVGGLTIGAILILTLVVGGHRLKLVELSLNPILKGALLHRPADRFSWRRSRWYTRCGATVSVVVFGIVTGALLLGMNVGLVKAQESGDVPEAAKLALYVLFAFLHELLNHFVRPLAVTSLSALLNTASPTFVILSTTIFQTTSSVIAPIIGLLISSEQCFGPRIFRPGQTPITTSSVNITNCVRNNGSFCTQHDRYEVGTTYDNPFEFDGSRCLSSIVVLYTPAFLYIFTVRVLTSPIAWWMARRGTPWLLAGTRPPMQLAGTFLSDRVWLLACFGLFQRKRIENPYTNMFKPVSQEALEILHAAEPVVLAFNKLVIAVCPGLLSPIVAVAALGCFLAQLGINTALGEAPTATLLPNHSFPVACLAMMLLFHSCYTVVILIAANFYAAGVAVVVINWVAFFCTRWYLMSCDAAIYAEIKAAGGDAADILKLQDGIVPAYYSPEGGTLLERLLDNEEEDDGSYEEMHPPTLQPVGVVDVEPSSVQETSA